MESFSSLLKKEHMGELVLVVLFIIYLIMGSKTPEPVAGMVDTLVGKIVIIITIIYLFMHANPILAVLALFVGFDLIRRSSMATGIDALQRIIYVNGSVEDKIAEKLKIKLANVNDINNGDLDLTMRHEQQML